jgi:hypothetical protein
MPLLELTTLETAKAAEIASDKRAAGSPRRTPWVENLEYVANLFMDGEVDADEYVKMANFTVASGARAKENQLRKGVLPFANLGTWEFKTPTWIKEDGKGRGSTLWAKFTPFTVEDDAGDNLA